MFSFLAAEYYWRGAMPFFFPHGDVGEVGGTLRLPVRARLLGIFLLISVIPLTILGLLAYNIGPRNGGLRAIMEQYGARDFVTIQPYLNTLPRDYPIRVLSAALAYRLWRTEGRLLPYEEGGNAVHIQSVGIPGLTAHS